MTLVAKLDKDKEQSVLPTKSKDLVTTADDKPPVKKNKDKKEKKNKALVGFTPGEPANEALPWNLPEVSFGRRAFNLVVKERKEIDEKERVYFNGVAIEPSESGIKSYGNSVRWKDTTFYANYAFDIPVDSLFSVYEIKSKDGKNTILFLDQWSYFEFTDGDLFYNREIEGKLLLLNSFVKNVVWHGSNDFINVHVENGSVRECSFIASRDKAGYSWDHYEYHHLSNYMNENQRWDAKYSDRHVYKDIRSRQSVFINSQVASGSYNATTIESSTITVPGMVDVNGGMFNICNLRFGSLTSENAVLRRCSLAANGKALISNVREENKIINSAETLYLDSKFAFTSITAPSMDDVLLLRVSETDYTIQRGMYQYDIAQFSSNDSEEVIKDIITEFTDGFNFRRRADGRISKVNKDNIFTNGIRDFIFDTVISRLRMISMLESARDLGEAVYPKAHSNIYSN